MKKILVSIVAMLVCIATYAQTYTPMTFGEEYPVQMFKNAYFQLTAPANGKVLLLGYNMSPNIVAQNGQQIVATFNGIYGGDEAGYYFNAQAGMSYRITYSMPFDNFNLRAVFEAAGTFTLQIREVLPAEGTPFSVAGDGQTYIRFNTNEVSFYEGTLTCGDNTATVYPLERWNELIANGTLDYYEEGTAGIVRNEDDFVWAHYDHGFLFEFRTMVYSWIESGTVHDGDELILELKDVKGEDMPYGGDGKLVVKWTVNANPLRLVSATVPSVLNSWYNSGDPESVATFVFSREVGSASAFLAMGNAEANDFWMDEELPQRVNIDGNVVTIDFSGVMRTYSTMNLNMAWGSYEFKIQSVRDTDGNPCYSDEQGADGSFSYNIGYRDITQRLSYEVVPRNGSTLTEDGKRINIWLSQNNIVEYDGVSVTWNTYDDEGEMQMHDHFISIDDCETEEIDGEVNIWFTMPQGAKDARNVRVALNVTKSLDGIEHPVVAYYNTSLAYDWDVSMYFDPSDGTTVNRLSEVYLPLFSTYAINPNAVITVRSDDGEYVGTASFEREGMVVAKLVLDEAITKQGRYTIVIPDGAVGDYYYGESNYTSGLACQACQLTIEVSGKYDGRDVVSMPADGDIVDELSEVTVEFLLYSNVSPTWDNSCKPYVESVADEPQRYAGDFTEQDEFSTASNKLVFTLDEAITIPGTYRLVLPAGSVANGATGDPLTTEYSFVFTVQQPDCVAGVKRNSKSQHLYNLQGQRVGTGYRGLVIRNQRVEIRE